MVHAVRGPEHGHVLAAAATVGAVAVLQAPARFIAYALLLRRLRHAHPELFDGAACVRSISACLEEYERELAGGKRI